MSLENIIIWKEMNLIMTLRIITKNNDFNQLDYADLGTVDPGIYIIIYDLEPWEDGPQIFAGICNDMAWGDGRDDPLNTQFVVLEQTHKLSKEKEWEPVNLLGRRNIETKFDVNLMHTGFTTPEEELDEKNNLNEKPKNISDYDYMEKLMIFTPKDSELSLDEAMALWLSTE